MMVKSFAIVAFTAFMLLGGSLQAFATTDDELNLSSPNVQQEYQQADIDTATAKDNILTQDEYNNTMAEVQQTSPEKYAQLQASVASSSSLGTNGDILITYDSNTSGWHYGHTAIVRFDNNYVIEAWPGDGVRNYKNNWKTRFNSKRAFWVKYANGDDYHYAQSYAIAKIGRPYSLATTKTSVTKFYCSKLVWQAWKSRGFDLDSNGGVLVTPANIEDDSQTLRYY